jgi:hypothetical protein
MKLSSSRVIYCRPRSGLPTFCRNLLPPPTYHEDGGCSFIRKLVPICDILLRHNLKITIVFIYLFEVHVRLCQAFGLYSARIIG